MKVVGGILAKMVGVIGVGVLVLVGSWSSSPSAHLSRPVHSVFFSKNPEIQSVLRSIRLEKRDLNGHQIVLQSPSAQASFQWICFQNPHADIQLKTHEHMTLQADQGHWNQKSNQLTLLGEVHLQHQAGIKIQSPKVFYQFQQDQFLGKKGIQIQYGQMTVQSQTFKTYHSHAIICLSGNVHLKTSA